jgi:hypothetical protein
LAAQVAGGQLGLGDLAQRPVVGHQLHQLADKGSLVPLGLRHVDIEGRAAPAHRLQVGTRADHIALAGQQDAGLVAQ